MVRKQDTKKTGIVGRIVKAAVQMIPGKLLSPFLSGDEPEKSEKPAKKKARTATPRDTAEPAVRRAPQRNLKGRVEPVESLDRHGAGRDERSFEQRRRGGPMTGGAPGKIRGPRHTGGSKRKGRDNVTSDIVDSLAALPIVDYDDLSADEIKARVGRLAPDEIRTIMSYEVANKHRKSIVTLLEKKLAA